MLVRRCWGARGAPCTMPCAARVRATMWPVVVGSIGRSVFSHTTVSIKPHFMIPSSPFSSSALLSSPTAVSLLAHPRQAASLHVTPAHPHPLPPSNTLRIIVISITLLQPSLPCAKEIRRTLAHQSPCITSPLSRIPLIPPPKFLKDDRQRGSHLQSCWSTNLSPGLPLHLDHEPSPQHPSLPAHQIPSALKREPKSRMLYHLQTMTLEKRHSLRRESYTTIFRS